MSEQKSPPFLAFKMSGDDAMSAAIADELHALATGAAKPVRPGESIKSQMNRAWVNLGRPPMWRLRSAWWRDGSGQWSAAAVKDFQDRYRAFLERDARRVAQVKAIEGAKRGVIEPAFVEATREQYESLVQRIAAIEATLRLRT
jgi:hypothetical protein